MALDEPETVTVRAALGEQRARHADQRLGGDAAQGAVLTYQLALLARYHAQQSQRRGLKPFLQAL